MSESGSTYEGGLDPPRLSAPRERRDEIEEFVRDVVDDAGVDGVVVNLSGGIDSSVTVTLAAEALGCDRVTGLVLPAAGTPQRDVDDAIRLAEELVVDYHVLDLQPIVDRFLAVLLDGTGAVRDAGTPTAVGSADALQRERGNLAARARMATAYFEANRTNRLVLGTGNRPELALGYFTKYGDGGVDALPLGDLYKTQVRDLARVLDVPETIVEKPPTAGLWEGQTDEAELGAPYPLVDAILEQLLDRDRDVDETATALGLERDRVATVATRVATNAHKRAVPPAPGDR
jgi:NAD+ synthase